MGRIARWFENLLDLAARACVQATPAPEPLTAFRLGVCRFNGCPREGIVVMPVRIAGKNVELGETSWWARQHPVRQRHAFFLARKRPNFRIEPPRIREWRPLQEVVCGCPAQKFPRRPGPWPVAWQAFDRPRVNLWLSIRYQIVRRCRLPEYAVRVHMANEISFADPIGVQLADLLAQVVVSVVRAQFESYAWGQVRLPAQPGFTATRDDDDDLGKPGTVALYCEQAQFQPLEIAPVTPDYDVAGHYFARSIILASTRNCLSGAYTHDSLVISSERLKQR